MRLSALLGLTENQVTNWFKNRRKRKWNWMPDEWSVQQDETNEEEGQEEGEQGEETGAGDALTH